MASITSSFGLGSGIDIGSLTEQLVAAEREPTEARFEAFETEYDAKISAFGSLKSGVNTFYNKLTALSSQSTFSAKTATSTDEDAFTATAFSSSSPGSYSIDVSTLAQAQTLTTGRYTAVTDEIGTGTLTFQFGTTSTGPYGFVEDTETASKDVTIDATNNTLEGIRDAVNDAEIGVTASIVYDGVGYKLSFVPDETGANNSIAIVTDDDDTFDADNAGLSELAFNSAAQNLTQAQAASDAALTINGIAVTSESNTITTAITGVTLNLVGTTTSAKTLTVANDTAGVESKVEELVEEYNALMQTITDLSGYDSNEETAGLLIGDFTLRSIESEIRLAMTGSVSGGTGELTGLADIGLSTDNETGQISINSTTLASALSSNFDDFAALFTVDGTATDSTVDFVTATNDSVVGNYAVNITTMATQGAYTGAGGLAFPVTISAANANKTFQVTVDGVVSNSLSLADGSYTGSELATEIQAQINADSKLAAAGVTVAVEYDALGLQDFTITSSNYGSSSNVTFNSVDTNMAADLGLTAVAGTAGTNVAGTINGETATGSGQFLTGTGTNTTGLKIQISGGATGDRGTINFTRGMAAELAFVLSDYRGATGLVESRIDDYEDRLDEIAADREDLNLRMSQLEDRLRSQFLVMDTLVGEFNNTLSFLDSQLAALTGNDDG